MHIRIAATADAVALADLNKEYNEVDATPEQMATQIAAARGHETALIAEDGGEVAGFACLRLVRCVCYAQPHAEVTELYIRPAHRRKGVGAALMRHAEKLAQEAGATELFLDTGFYNHDAQTLYRSLGYSIDALKMRKRI
jgi:ribosomal protein S18 acetylase RimI-like enzyme